VHKTFHWATWSLKTTEPDVGLDVALVAEDVGAEVVGGTDA
jgi:hypothetical protein